MMISGGQKVGLLLMLLACFLPLVLVGCVSTSGNGRRDTVEIPSLEPAALLKFADVPVPSGFLFVSEESYAFQSSGFRAALLKYSGKASGNQVVVFFKEQMPLYNWHLINIIEYGRRMLSYEKDKETANITIDEEGKRTYITVSVAPKSDLTPVKSSSKPLK